MRYSRQTALEGVGAAGQARLRAAAVSVPGPGDAAAVAALYLVGAGVGRCHTDALDPAELRSLNPDTAVGPLAEAPPTALVADPEAIHPGPAAAGDSPPLPELSGALAAARALVSLLETAQ